MLPLDQKKNRKKRKRERGREGKGRGKKGKKRKKRKLPTNGFGLLTTIAFTAIPDQSAHENPG